jgi:FkbM family methyltransferase
MFLKLARGEDNEFMETILKFAQKIARRAGYRIEPAIEPPDAPIDVLDMLVRRECSGRKDFYFVQIGANDGLRFDPIRKYILEYHWRGLLVEPVPYLFEQLVKNYAGEAQLDFESAAIGPEDGQIMLYTIPASADVPDFMHGMTSVSPDVLQLQRWQLPEVDKLIQQLRVPCLTLETLLDRHRVQRVDLLQIDVEGYDFEILKMWDFERYMPAIIQYEHAHLSPVEKIASLAFLHQRGYRTAAVRGDTIAHLAKV